jgi:hypothetical protein
MKVIYFLYNFGRKVQRPWISPSVEMKMFKHWICCVHLVTWQYVFDLYFLKAHYFLGKKIVLFKKLKCWFNIFLSCVIRCEHTFKQVSVKIVIDSEGFKEYTNMWVHEYLKNHFEGQFSFWLHVLETLHPKNIPREYSKFGKHMFPLMGVTCNYESHPHCDNDLLFSIISWFKKSKLCSLFLIKLLCVRFVITLPNIS